MDNIKIAGRLRLWDDSGAKAFDSLNMIVNEGLNVCAMLVGKAAVFDSNGIPFSFNMYTGSSTISQEDTSPSGTLVSTGKVVSYNVDTEEHCVTLGLDGVNTAEADVTKVALFYGDYLFSEILANLSPGTSYSGSWTIYFVPSQVVISTSVSPSGSGSVSGGGTYAKGDTVTLVATPSGSYSFASWSTGETSSTLSFIADESKAYVAYFNLSSFTITVACEPEEGGSVSGGGTYSYGEYATIEATANETNGYVFLYWSDGSYSNPRSVEVVGDAIYTAIFEANEWHVILYGRAQDGSSIDVTFDGAGYYQLGTSVTVTAPSSTTSNGTRYTFEYWSDGTNRLSTSRSYTFTIEGYTTLYAYYEAESSED